MKNILLYDDILQQALVKRKSKKQEKKILNLSANASQQRHHLLVKPL